MKSEIPHHVYFLFALRIKNTDLNYTNIYIRFMNEGRTCLLGYNIMCCNLVSLEISFWEYHGMITVL